MHDCPVKFADQAVPLRASRFTKAVGFVQADCSRSRRASPSRPRCPPRKASADRGTMMKGTEIFYGNAGKPRLPPLMIWRNPGSTSKSELRRYIMLELIVMALMFYMICRGAAAASDIFGWKQTESAAGRAYHNRSSTMEVKKWWE